MKSADLILVSHPAVLEYSPRYRNMEHNSELLQG